MAKSTQTARQITLFFVGCFTLATLALGCAAFIIASSETHRQLDEMIASDAAGLQRAYAAGGTPALQRAILRRDDRGVNTLGYLLFDRDGRRIGGELETPPPPPGWHDIEFRDLDDEHYPARALTIEMAGGLRLTVAAETEAAAAIERMIVMLFAGGFGVMLLTGLVGGLLFGRAIRGRLETMNATAVAIIGGDLTSRVPLSGRDDEFDRLAATLNRMLDRTNILVRNLRQVSSDLAHDLRTPITRLRQRLERLRAGVTDETRQAAEIDRAIADADAALSLFSALLRIAEVESGALRRFFRKVDLTAIVAALVDSYQPVAEDGGRTLTASIAPGLFVEGDPELLSQMLVNLLENALRHTPPRTEVTVTLERDSDAQARLRIADNGQGVPAEHRAHLAERFTRVDPARSTPGYGLGLNLVAAVVNSHGGGLQFEDNNPGLAVVIRLPTADLGLRAARD